MKKAFSFLIILVLCFAVLSGCGDCEHEWVEANCKDPKTCTLCGAEEGEKLGHKWQEATCEEPEICTVCNKVKGEPLGHNYESIVLEPTMFEEGYTTHTCLNCGHSYVDGHTEALGYELTEGTMVFKPDGVAYLYGSGGKVVKTYTGWMTEVYGFNDNYEETAGGVAITVPWNPLAGDWDITRVIIEDGVKPVSTAFWFFGCFNLQSVYFGDSVESLSDSTFSGCESLTDIQFSPNSNLKTIGVAGLSEFNGHIEIPKSVTHIGSLPTCEDTIILHEGLLSIGDNVLCGSDVIIPNSVTEIGVGNFDHMIIPDDHPHFAVIDNCLIQTDTHTLVDTKDGFKIPTDGSVTALGRYLFYREDLPELTIPNCVTEIGEYAFAWSTLSNIEIPEGVTVIRESAFYRCNNLQNVTLPEGLLSIEAWAFHYTDLVSINIPDRVTTIGHAAFSDCANLSVVTLPSSLLNIGSSAFSGCDKLTNVVLPAGLVSIGDYAFSRCKNLTSIEIPASVTEIGCSPFTRCEHLTSITVADDNPEFYIFDHCLVSRAGKTVIAVFGKTEIPTGVEIIGDYAFYQYDGFHTVILPEGIIHIGDGAFLGTEMTSISLPDGVTYIGSGAFGTLETLEIPTSVTYIGDQALECVATVYYAGTAEQWKNIEVKNQCAPGMEITVVCTDQTIYVGSWW